MPQRIRNTSSGIQPFGINYGFVHQYVPMDSDPKVQLAVTFSNRKDVDLSQIDVVAHICLVLDISGSMNKPDKYPFLLEAIPCVVDSLSDNDWLSVVLFSSRSELVWSKDVKSSRGREQEIIHRIEQSGVKFEQTYLSKGLNMALNEIQYFSQYHPNAINRLYILTDGQLHDASECCNFTSEIRRLGIEINSYGFGQDFAEETMREIMDSCKGGRVKCIYHQEKLPKEFKYIGEVASRLVATEAEFELRLSPNVIPGDAFRFEPGAKFLGVIDETTRRFSIQIGGLEKGRNYIFAFEARLQPSNQEYEQIGTAILRYTLQGQQYIVSQDIFVNRTQEERRYSIVDNEIEDWFAWLEGLRTNDPKAMMDSLQARLKILRQKGSDQAQVELLEQVIDKLDREGTLDGLSQIEKRRLRADNSTVNMVSHPGF